MLKKTLLLFSLGIFVTSLLSFTSRKTRPVVRTIIIDAGHGGKDQGAAGLESTEAQIALEISKKLGKEIERNLPDVKVLYTRTKDVLPGDDPNDKNKANRWRANFANSSGADLFISIHLNSIGKHAGGWYEKRIIAWNNKVTYVGKGKKRRKKITKIPVYQPYYVVNTTTGTETFIWTAKENSHKEQMVQGEFSGEGDSSIIVPENDPAIRALKLLYTKKFFKNSFQLADLVQQEFTKRGRINRGVKQRNEKGIWVLHATGMPSVLIETGFISNKEEEQYMLSDKGQDEIVEDIANALKNYVALLEKQQAATANTTSFLPPVDRSPYAFLEMIDEHERHRGE